REKVWKGRKPEVWNRRRSVLPALSLTVASGFHRPLALSELVGLELRERLPADLVAIREQAENVPQELLRDCVFLLTRSLRCAARSTKEFRSPSSILSSNLSFHVELTLHYQE